MVNDSLDSWMYAHPSVREGGHKLAATTAAVLEQD